MACCSENVEGLARNLRKMSKHRKKNIPSTPEQAPVANNDVEEDMDISDDEEGLC